MSFNLQGEHERQVWLTDAELDLLREAVGFRICADEQLIPAETIAGLKALSRRLEELK
jgi:hypothetical protein